MAFRSHCLYRVVVAIRARCRNAAFIPQYRQLFVADGLPKTQFSYRWQPHYLETVRESPNYLETVDLDREERFWRWLIQHESQARRNYCFCAAITTVGRSRERGQGDKGTGDKGRGGILYPSQPSDIDEMVEIPAGEQGNESLDALDNERPVHRINLETY